MGSNIKSSFIYIVKFTLYLYSANSYPPYPHRQLTQQGVNVSFTPCYLNQVTISNIDHLAFDDFLRTAGDAIHGLDPIHLGTPL